MTDSQATLAPENIITCKDAHDIRPVSTDYNIGAYIYPGWDTRKQWAVVPQQPYLGHYDQGRTEAVDWFIKWAREYGVSFFAFDWYYHHGKLWHNSNVEALMKCANREQIKFCLHACNESYFHPVPGKGCEQYFDFGIQWDLSNEDIEHDFTEADFLAQFTHIADNYFTSPSYLQVDGKMVFVQYRTNLIMRLLGVERTREIYEKVREMLRRRGFELYLVAGGSCTHPEYLHQVKDAGFDALTAYNWVDYQPVQLADRVVMRSTYEACLDIYQKNWRKLHEACRAQDIDFIPPLLSGFDNTPWSGSVVMRDSTPEKFESMCRNALPHIKGPQMALICAWNEWGEGSVLEPTKEHGFGYLNAVRRVFTREAAPVNPHHVPADPEAFAVTQ